MTALGLVQKTVIVIRTIAAKPGGIGLSTLARECGIPKATCHRIVMTLVDEGWLSVDPVTKQFRVSLSLLFMLGDVAGRNAAFSYTREILAALAVDAKETAGLDQLAGSSVIVLTQAIGPFLVSHGQQAVPRMLPAWRTSSGKALLSWADPGVVRREFQSDPDLARTNLYPDFDAFVADLAQTRERGYAFAIDELEDGAAAVAAPVHVGASVPYAVWVGGPTYRLTAELIPQVAERVIAAASDLARILEASSIADLSLQALSLPSI
jgi:DNA-binding IclR family transcriptional regulator